tara:strand:+ start:6827 stop:7498 length:672 start_codon:yes stop_codon:yes gene_type:complete
MKISIIIFPGSNCDQDIASSLISITKKKPNLVWYKDSIPLNSNLIILPGGFSFGDYLRSGAIASASKIIKEVVSFSKRGIPIIGICNGFQILTEANLLPGTLVINNNLKFICKDVFLKVINNNSIFTKAIKSKVFKLPIAHKMGNYVISKIDLEKIKSNDQILFKYCSQNGDTTSEYNPNGSVDNIAGILSHNHKILGMMPHPERFTKIQQKDLIMNKILRSL